MSLNSSSKRRAGLTGRTGVVLPNPDGSIAAADRAQVTGVYQSFAASAIATSGFLFPDYYCVVAKITLKAKDGGDGVAYWFGNDYHAEGTIYATNPNVYPLLAQDLRVQRGVRIYDAIRYDMSLSLFSKVDIEHRGQTFASLLEDYELHGALVEVRRYHRPRGSTTTDADDPNLRAKYYEVIGAIYDDGNGITTLQCRDVWFKDKELNRTLAMRPEDNADQRYDGEYGNIVFGQSSTTGQGIVVDAPIFKSYVESGVPNIWLYLGWSYNSGTHGIKEIDRILVRNKNKLTNSDDWIEVDCEFDPETPILGDAQATQATDPPNYPLDLSYYKRGQVFTIAGDGSIVSAVRAKMSVPAYDRCADIAAGQYLWNNNNPDFLSMGDSHLSIEFWVKFDSLHSGVANRVVMQQGDASEGNLEWVIYFNTSDDKLRFGISHNGTTIGDTVATPSGLSTGTWYHVVCGHNPDTNEIEIFGNNAGPYTTATTGVMDRRNGTFSVGTKGTTLANFDGRLKSLRIYKYYLGSSNVTDLYGGGSPIIYDGLVDGYRVYLRGNWDLSEPSGLRYDQHGSAHLTPGMVSDLIPQDIVYDFSNRALTFSNLYGSPIVRIYEVDLINSGASVEPKGGPLRTTTRDITGLSTSATDEWFQVDPPLPLADGVSYLVEMDFDNIRTNSYYPKSTWNSNTGSTHYYLPKRQDDAAWQLGTDNRLDLQLYGVGRTTLALTTEEHVEMGTITMIDLTGVEVDLHAGQDYLEVNKDLEFKVGVKGLKDEAGGVYTGTANAVISNPSDITRFVLMNNDLGVGLDSTRVDTTALTTVRTLLAERGIAMQIAISKPMGADEFVRELARQSRTVFFKNRIGKLSLHFPVPAGPIADMDAILFEGRMGDELLIISDADSDYSDVVNDFTQYYSPENLNQPDDPSVLRKAFQEKLAGKLVTNDAESSTGDEYHTGLCAASKVLYGKREMTSPLDFFDNSTAAGTVQLYYVTRYSTLARRVQVRVPARDYYDQLDLFSTLHANHTGLRSANGTAGVTLVHDGDGEEVSVWTSEGIPTRVYSGGAASGIIVEVVEEGPWMTLTIETTPNF